MKVRELQIQNHFGTVKIEPATDYLPVEKINYHHNAAQENDFDLETAEKISLITGNKGIQIAFSLNGRAYLVLHNSPATAAICRVSVEHFECDITPKDMIEQR